MQTGVKREVQCGVGRGERGREGGRERERAEGGEVETRVQSGCSGEWGDEWSGESGLEGGVERIGVYSHSIMTYREVEKQMETATSWVSLGHSRKVLGVPQMGDPFLIPSAV